MWKWNKKSKFIFLHLHRWTSRRYWLNRRSHFHLNSEQQTTHPTPNSQCIADLSIWNVRNNKKGMKLCEKIHQCHHIIVGYATIWYAAMQCIAIWYWCDAMLCDVMWCCPLITHPHLLHHQPNTTQWRVTRGWNFVGIKDDRKKGRMWVIIMKWKIWNYANVSFCENRLLIKKFLQRKWNKRRKLYGKKY